MKTYLTAKERTRIFKDMTRKEKKVIEYVVGKNHRKHFDNLLAQYKGTKDWSFYRYIDHGKMRKDVKCECGQPLRHEYILINKKTKEKRTIGSTHLVKELNIPDHIATEVLKGINYINRDLDELLQKYDNGWELSPFLRNNSKGIKKKLSKSIQLLISMDLPLLDRHLDLMYDQISLMNSKKKRQGKLFIEGYEIKSETVYKVATGEIDSDYYFERKFRKEIDSLLRKQRRYVPDYDIINHLIKNGMPIEIAFGQHVLSRHLRAYLSKRKDIKTDKDIDGYALFKLTKIQETVNM